MQEIATDRHLEVCERESEEPEEHRVKEPTRKARWDQHKEQQEVTEKGELAKTGEPAKLTPWTTGREEEQSRGKKGGQSEGAFKKLGSKVR